MKNKEKENKMQEDDSKKNKKSKKEKEDSKKILFYVVSIIILIALILLIVFVSIQENKNKETIGEDELSYTDLIKQIDEGNVEKVTMTVGSTTVEAKLKDQEEPKTVIVPSTQAFIELVQDEVKNGNYIELVQVRQSIFLTITDRLFTLLPTILLVVLFVLIIQMQGLGSKGKVYDPEEEVKTTFDDVAGLDEEKQEMIEIVNFLKNPDEFYKMGAKIPKGVLLCGQPGTGKTLIAKAIAGEADVPFIPMSGSEFIEMFAGLGASRVRKL